MASGSMPEAAAVVAAICITCSASSGPYAPENDENGLGELRPTRSVVSASVTGTASSPPSPECPHMMAAESMPEATAAVAATCVTCSATSGPYAPEDDEDGSGELRPTTSAESASAAGTAGRSAWSCMSGSIVSNASWPLQPMWQGPEAAATSLATSPPSAMNDASGTAAASLSLLSSRILMPRFWSCSAVVSERAGLPGGLLGVAAKCASDKSAKEPLDLLSSSSSLPLHNPSDFSCTCLPVTSC
mmetsp:Transcript_84254/g.219262  ORF Transcript_84254/g.219262 Transcript_84254/m.219262 type:complete len:246 (-) Transcript_84254:118-855(-)